MTAKQTNTLPGTAARRPAGEGHVEELPSGRFRVKLRDPAGGWMPSPTYATREEAESYRRGVLKILADADADGTLPEADSLQRFGDAWLDAEEKLGHLASIHTLRSQWVQHIAGTPLAAMCLPTIRESDVRAWLDALQLKRALVPAKGGGHKASARRIARDTVSKVVVLLRQILEAARERGVVRANAAKDVHVRTRRTAKADDVWTFLTLDEIARMEACTAIPEPHRIVYLVAVYTGMRQGELWGLHWRDVHLDGDRPQVVVRFSHGGPPKNGKVRHVPLLAPARELLTRWKAIAPTSERGLVFCTRTGERRGRSDDARWADYYVARLVRGPNGKVLKDADGTPIRDNVRCEGFSKRVGFGRDVRFHDLRHTCASHLVMGSWGVQWTLSEIAAFLGHSDTEVTERYAHLSPDHLHAKASQTARRGTETAFHEAPADFTKPLARPRGLEPLTSRSVAGSTPLDLQCPAPSRGTVVERARRLIEAAATGKLPETLIQELVRGVLAFEPVRLAADLAAPGADNRFRVRNAINLAASIITELSDVESTHDDADSADTADSHS